MGLQEVQLEDDEFDVIERCLRSAEQSATCGSKRKLPLSPLPVPTTAAPRLLCRASAFTFTTASAQCSRAAPDSVAPQPVASSTFTSTVRRVPASLQRPQPQPWGGSSSKQPKPSSAPSAAAQASTSQQLVTARQASGPASTSGRRDAAPDLGLRQLQFNGRIVYACTAAEVDAACLQLLHGQGPRVIGLDIEWCARYIRGQAPDLTALLQICYCRGADGAGDVRPEEDGRGCVCLLLHLKHSGMTALLKVSMLHSRLCCTSHMPRRQQADSCVHAHQELCGVFICAGNYGLSRQHELASSS